MPYLKEKYLKEVIPYLKKEFSYKNVLACPKIEKVVINVGVGKATSDPKILDEVSRHLMIITGQRPTKSYARKSIDAFKIKKGAPIGVYTTLRGKKMYEFLERLINIVLPRLRDFRGLRPRFDRKGNYTIGISEVDVFPELTYEEIKYDHGLEITIVSTAKNDQEGKKLLEVLGFPFRKV